MDQTAPSHQEVSGQQGEHGQDSNLVRAIYTYMLITLIKKEFQLNASLYTLLQILSVSVFEKTEALQALQIDSNPIDNADNGNQLNLSTF